MTTTACHGSGAPVEPTPGLVRIALVGSPNAGKTSVYNQLTGMRARTGNYPGVTVTRSVGTGRYKPDDGSPTVQFSIEDLPGAYSLHPISPDEQIVAGVAHGLMGLHDEVTWRARHLGVRQSLTSRITAFDPPHHFRDSMVRGAFARFDHDHFFSERDGVTTMRDVFAYTSPLGPLGRLADVLFLAAYMRRFLAARAAELRRVAESEDWRAFAPA